MLEFNNFVNQFSKFKDSYGDISGDSYGWVIGENIKAQFESEVNDLNFTTVMNTFNIGDKLLGVSIIDITDIKPDGIFLLKVDEFKVESVIEDVTFYQDTFFDKQNIMLNPITNRGIYWPIKIKKGTLKIRDSVNEYCDDLNGNIFNIKYLNKEINTNEQNGISIFGTINYNSCLLTINRFDSKNLLLFYELIDSANRNQPVDYIVKDFKDNLQIEVIFYGKKVELLNEYFMK